MTLFGVRTPRPLALAATAAVLLAVGACASSGVATSSASPSTAAARTATTSAPVASTAPPATPTPTPDPAIWRFEGVVVDASGHPLEGVCVVIGPLGCSPHSVHTDARGVYFFDVPQKPAIEYDLTFEKDGYVPVLYRAEPSGPTVFNVVLTAK